MGKSFLVVRDELNGLFGNMNKYSKGKGADEEQLLELYDGHPFRSLRISDSCRSYERCSVSICGNIQPPVLEEALSNGDPTGQWARFILAPFPDRIVRLPTNITEAAQKSLENATRLLQEVALKVYRLRPQTYHLCPGGIELFSNYEYEKQESAHVTKNGAQAALHGKSAGKVLRISGVLHILHTLRSLDSKSLPIGTKTLEDAISIVDYEDSWALSQYIKQQAENENVISVEMRRIHNIAFTSKGPMTWTQIRECMSGDEKKGLNRARAEEEMRKLELLGVGRIVPGKRNGLCYQAIKALPG
jgi:hypothetical protein